jgi:hypothetical protein
MTRSKENSAKSTKPYCQERHRLSDSLLASVHELMKLLDQQTKAIIENDDDFGRFDDLIHVAHVAKNDAKYALLAHIQAHGCD